MHPLIAFHSGQAPDHRGRYLRDILRRDDTWLEATHDYIQWLFPLPERSGVLPSAPLIDAEVVAAFAADERLRASLAACFARMLAFYGLEERAGRVEKGPNWAARRANWFLVPTHNNLRITRILRCLVTLGLRPEAERFAAGLEALAGTEPDCGVGATAFAYWRDALGTRGSKPEAPTHRRG